MVTHAFLTRMWVANDALTSKSGQTGSTHGPRDHARGWSSPICPLPRQVRCRTRATSKHASAPATATFSEPKLPLSGMLTISSQR